MADCVESSNCCDAPTEACCNTSVDEMLKLFNEVDKDGDSLITKEELAELLARLGHKDMCHEKIGKIFSEVDDDKDEKINFEQFRSFLPIATEL